MQTNIVQCLYYTSFELLQLITENLIKITNFSTISPLQFRIYQLELMVIANLYRFLLMAIFYCFKKLCFFLNIVDSDLK